MTASYSLTGLLPVEIGTVALIEDEHGGTRVVVSSDDRTFRSQAQKGERIFIVPNFYEPMYRHAPGYPEDDGHHRVAWGRIPAVIERAERAYRERSTWPANR